MVIPTCSCNINLLNLTTVFVNWQLTKKIPRSLILQKALSTSFNSQRTLKRSYWGIPLALTIPMLSMLIQNCWGLFQKMLWLLQRDLSGRTWRTLWRPIIITMRPSHELTTSILWSHLMNSPNRPIPNPLNHPAKANPSTAEKHGTTLTKGAKWCERKKRRSGEYNSGYHKRSVADKARDNARHHRKRTAEVEQNGVETIQVEENGWDAADLPASSTGWQGHRFSDWVGSFIKSRFINWTLGPILEHFHKCSFDPK